MSRRCGRRQPARAARGAQLREEAHCRTRERHARGHSLYAVRPRGCARPRLGRAALLCISILIGLGGARGEVVGGTLKIDGGGDVGRVDEQPRVDQRMRGDERARLAPRHAQEVAVRAVCSQHLNRLRVEHGIEDRYGKVDVAKMARAVFKREVARDTAVEGVDGPHLLVVEAVGHRLVERVEQVRRSDRLDRGGAQLRG